MYTSLTSIFFQKIHDRKDTSNLKNILNLKETSYEERKLLPQVISLVFFYVHVFLMAYALHRQIKVPILLIFLFFQKKVYVGTHDHQNH